jgi:hypothetical protein
MNFVHNYLNESLTFSLEINTFEKSSIIDPFNKDFPRFQVTDFDESSLNECLYQNNDYAGYSLDLNQFQDSTKNDSSLNIKENQNNISGKPTNLQTPSQSSCSNDAAADMNIIINKGKENKTKTKNKSGINLGRKRRSDEREAYHTKYRSDNMMRKIKTYFMNFVHNYLNESLTFSHKTFLKINKKVSENLRKDFNMSLMQMTIKEIYEQHSINEKYSDYKKGRNINQALIKEIFEKNKDIETIKILNSKYIDLIIVLRTKFLDKFSSDLIEKEIKLGENKDDSLMYVNELKDLLINYEEWFEKKSGRCKI